MSVSFLKRNIGGVAVAFAVALLILLMSGCRVGPDYKRPVVDVPNQYRSSLAPEVTQPSVEKTIADGQWPRIFRDPALERLIEQALRNNLDLRIAAARVLQAQTVVGIARSQQMPQVNGSLGYTALQIPSALAGNNSDGSAANSFFRGGGPSASATWNLDFWGLYRRQAEAARAELLASEWGQRATRTTLIEEVAEAYFAMRSLDAQIAITENTIKARQDSLALTRTLDELGAGSLADIRQAEELLYAARSNLPELRRQLVAEENTISVLLGNAPEMVDRGLPVSEEPHPEQIPVGVPSQLLERRPDVQQAEAKLIAANARIGVARAQYFPQISLTSLGGAASNQLNAIATGPNSYWYAAGSISEPIFDGGRIRNNYRLSKAQQQEMILVYQKTILNALKDVSNSLTAYKETEARRAEQTKQVKAAEDAVRLARLRYSGGYASYLEVLTTDTDLYSAQLLLATTQQQEASSLVQVYAALGGGWK